jgi:RNA polymerase sigma-70 factor (ECF subfamily)
MTDQQLRRLLSSSPEKAHRLIFDEYYNYVYTIVFNRLRSLGTPEDIDECISDVFAEIFTKYNSESSHSGNIKGFVSAIARNRSIDMFRRIRSGVNATVSLDADEAVQLSSEERIDEQAERTETAHALLDAVKSLGEPDSTIIIQKYYYGRSSEDIGDMIDMKPNTVRKRLSRALSRLRDILREDDEGR